MLVRLHPGLRSSVIYRQGNCAVQPISHNDAFAPQALLLRGRGLVLHLSSVFTQRGATVSSETDHMGTVCQTLDAQMVWHKH